MLSRCYVFCALLHNYIAIAWTCSYSSKRVARDELGFM